MDIWGLAEAGHVGNESADAGKSGNYNVAISENGEVSSTLLVVGDSGCGKSTLLQSFLKPNVTKEPKSTFALENSFARRKNAERNGKSLVHIWELGGDIYEPKLLNIPLTVSTLPNAAIIICLDLSKPQDCFLSMKRWVSLVREHISTKYAELRAGGSQSQTIANEMKETALAAYGSSTGLDSSRVRVCEVPILFVANKNDQFRSKHSSSDRRSLLQVLRFAAHYHGASLVVTSMNDSNSKEVFRMLMNQYCFGVAMKPVCDVTADRTVVVTAGKDSFTNILTDKSAGKTAEEDAKSAFASTESDVNTYITPSGVNKEAWARFETILASVFGAPNPNAGKGPGLSLTEGASSNKQSSEEGSSPGQTRVANDYPEADVDEARAARDLILDQYMQDAARREKLILRSNGGNVVEEGEQETQGGRVNDATEIDDNNRRRARK